MKNRLDNGSVLQVLDRLMFISDNPGYCRADTSTNSRNLDDGDKTGVNEFTSEGDMDLPAAQDAERPESDSRNGCRNSDKGIDRRRRPPVSEQDAAQERPDNRAAAADTVRPCHAGRAIGGRIERR
jgi:hypothetical protein